MNHVSRITYYEILLFGFSSPMPEVEAKYLIDDPGQVPALLDFLAEAKVQVDEATGLEVVDQYFDTPDWRVFRAGWAYRWQNASGTLRFCLKSLTRSDGAIQVREEVEQPAEGFPVDESTLPDGPVQFRLGPVLEGARPRRLFEVSKKRRRFFLRPGPEAIIELDVDDSRIRSLASPAKLAPGEMEFLEVELEILRGDPDTLRRLARAIQENLNFRASRLSKFERGLRTVGLVPPGIGRSPSLHQPQPTEPVYVLIDYSLRVLKSELANQEDTAWEGLDPEGVHQMRVATRKIREVLRLFRPFIPERSCESLNREFQWLARVLGNVRDLDVYRANFDHYSSSISATDAEQLAPYREELNRQWRKARRRLVPALESRRYQRLLSRFEAFLSRGPSLKIRKSSRDYSIACAGHDLIQKRYRQVLRDGRKIRASSPAQALHDLRIRCKRLRYACEFFEPIYGKRLKKFLARLKLLQDVLGDHQDACVASEKLRAYADTVPFRKKNRGLLVALGQLMSGQQHMAKAQRTLFRKVWARFDRKKVRKVLDKALSKALRRAGEAPPP